MIGWIEAHGIESLVAYYIFAAITGGMPTPGDSAGIAYRWAFSSLGLLSANLARLIATQMPSTKMGQALNKDSSSTTPVTGPETGPSKN